MSILYIVYIIVCITTYITIQNFVFYNVTKEFQIKKKLLNGNVRTIYSSKKSEKNVSRFLRKY